MTTPEKLSVVACVAIFIAVAFRLNVRLFHWTKPFSWLPNQRSSIARALFDRPIRNTLWLELCALALVITALVYLLPPLPHSN